MYSFDIFDTLITRNTASPYGIFLIMQEQLKDNNILGEHVFDNFAELRIKAEKNARQFSCAAEISLKDIYIELSKMSYLTDKEIDQLMAFEVQTEIDCAVGIEKNIQEIVNLYKKGEHVVLISDMYLSESSIRNIMTKVHPIFNEITIYVSSEYNCTKNDGLLYVKIKHLEGITYANWIHYGDNYISDICIPNTLGITTVNIEPINLFPWEQELISSSCFQSDLALQVAIGIIKKIRIQYKLDYTENIGLSLGGIILFSYVEWIIQQCVLTGIKSLYFISRDGFILKKIADKYISINQLDLKTKYIFGSRKAWRVNEPEKKDLVLQYLLQEVVFTKSKFAFVDLHGTGLSIEYLEKILGEQLDKSITVFYYDMASSVKNPRCDFRVFTTSECSEIIELLCRAPHGATIGYELIDGRYMPQLEPIHIHEANVDRLQDYIYGVTLFALEAASFIFKYKIKIRFNHLGEFLLKYCRTNPDSLILNFIGEIPFDSENVDENKKYAPKLSRKRIFQLFMWRTSENIEKYYDGTNLKLSLLRMEPKEQKFFEFCKRNHTSVIGKIVHTYKNILFRNEFVRKRIKVIIYAAGKFGKELHEQLQSIFWITVVAWTDINYKKYQKLGYPVKMLNSVLESDYEMLVIAIRDERKTERIKEWLTEIGVNSEKIVGGGEFIQRYLADSTI